MIRRVVFAQADYDLLRAHVLQGRDEQAAVCLGGHVATDELLGLLVREVHPVPPEALVTNSGAFVEIDVEWLAAIIKRARMSGQSVIVVHSHPFVHDDVRFSSIDTAGHAQLMPRLQARIPDVPHAEIVFGQDSAHALIWPAGSNDPADVDYLRVIGSAIVDVPAGTRRSDVVSTVVVERATERQVLFLGQEGQRRLSHVRAGVVGASGNGSPLAVQLIHLGVGCIVSVDPQVTETENRNRIIAARPDDDGVTAKVDILRRYVSDVRPRTKVIPLATTIEDAWRELRDCDVLFGCTDDLSSRLVLNRIASEYMIPLIDVGVEIEVVDGTLRTIAARVNVVRPGASCLEALGITSEAAARAEVAARRRPGYVDDDPAASAMPANLLAVGLAGIDFLKLWHGLLGGSATDRYFAYSARSGEVRACAVDGRACAHCRDHGGLGDLAPSPVAALEADAGSLGA